MVGVLTMNVGKEIPCRPELGEHHRRAVDPPTAFALRVDGAAQQQFAFFTGLHTQLIQHLEGGIIDEILVKEGDTVAHVFRLLCPGHVECVKEGIIGWRFDDLRNVTVMMRILFNHQNALYERLELSEEMNERVSEEIAQLLECSLT